jgi:hypothetical protein
MSKFKAIEVEKPSKRWVLPAVAAVVSAIAIGVCAYNINWLELDQYLKYHQVTK